MRLLTAAFSILLSTSSMAGSIPTTPHLYVKGYSEVSVQPDTAIINVAINEKSKNLQEAKENVDDVVAKALSIAKSFGVKANHIHAEQLNVYKQTRYNRSTNEEEFTGFKVSRNITLKLKNIDKYPELLQAFVDSGINQFNNTQFVVEDKSEIMKELKQNAIKQAKLGAKELADGFGVKVGDLYSVSFSPMNVPIQPYARGKVMAAESMSLQDAYSTGDTKLTAEVYAVYYID
ncbi:SIMPL domain-containing protein [Pseudoalteromonas luteoviolacea]|uniref:SIMPL domain-containing protein n=1 Tax=Pseudoalteromonas luteoviolacea TaxID=43657 RepID=UPI001F36410C|nr:SIMPL domain-containing protein [Pseudoalteromonas luteoviolacea]MCF6442316.1 SIMPL domain-containing protein [Pseudoalteromonas luteoviolacea]